MHSHGDRFLRFLASHWSYDSFAFWNSFSISQRRNDVQVDSATPGEAAEPAFERSEDPKDIGEPRGDAVDELEE